MSETNNSGDDYTIKPVPPTASFDQLTPQQKAVVLIGSCWNGVPSQQGESGKRPLLDTRPPSNLRDIYQEEVTEEVEHYLRKFRSQGFIMTETVARRKIKWAPMPNSQPWFSTILDHTTLHVPDYAFPVQHLDRSPVNIGLLGDTPSSLTHRFLVARLTGMALNAGFSVTPYDCPNPTVDRVIRPNKEYRPTAVKVWEPSTLSRKHLQEWGTLQQIEYPVIHIFKSPDLLKTVLGRVYRTNMILSTRWRNPQTWSSTFRRDHALDFLEDIWKPRSSTSSAAGDILTMDAFLRSDMYDIWEHYCKQCARFGIELSE